MRSIELKPLFRSFALAGAAMLSTVSTTSLAADVSLYTTREPKLIQPLLDEFTKDTIIKVNTVFVKDGLIERVKAECDKSPADVLMTVYIGNLLDLVEAGITQPIDSKILQEAIPANLRGADKQWYTLSLRDRVAYVAKDLDVNAITYEAFADPKWKGKVCIQIGRAHV